MRIAKRTAKRGCIAQGRKPQIANPFWKLGQPPGIDAAMGAIAAAAARNLICFRFKDENPGRQFEFVQSQWINDGDIISKGDGADPIAGRKDSLWKNFGPLPFI